MSSVYSKLDRDEAFDFRLIVTGTHLSQNFGSTVDNIKADGFHIEDCIYNLVDTSNKTGRILSLGNQIPGLVQTLNRVNPDIVLVAGDREDAISVCMTAAFLNIPVCHFFGGDYARDGNIDNSIRNAASKFAHLHFPTLEEHKANLVKLGEEEWRIHPVGNPALDRFLSTPEKETSEISQALDFSLEANNYAVLIYHPIISAHGNEYDDTKTILEALVAKGYQCLINFPNADTGNYWIRKAYQEFKETYPDQFYLFHNLSRDLFVNILRNAKMMLGNSSSGLLEAPSLGLPAINIGPRQRGRKHGDNVIFTDVNNEQIINAMQKVEEDEAFLKKVKQKQNPYGDGNASGKIVNILHSLKLDNQLIFKQ